MGKSLARITVLTPQAQKVIAESLAEGNYLTTACSLAGISTDTFYHWKNRHDAGDPGASDYSDFFGEVKKASAFAEVMALRAIRTGGFGWQGSAWFLERRFPKKWGRKAEAKPKAQLEADHTTVAAVEASPEFIAEVLNHLDQCASQPSPRSPVAAEVEPPPADVEAARVPLP